MQNQGFTNREDISALREITDMITNVISAIRVQNSCLKRTLLEEFLIKLDNIYKYIPQNLLGEFSDMISQLSPSIEAQDDILTADYLETVTQPFFKNILETEVSKADPALQSINVTENLTIELTASGNYTMRFKGIYFHSNVSPVNEAKQLAKYWDEPKEKVSLVLGLGLGYHIAEMLKLDAYRKVYVFEPEKEIIEACKKYGSYKEIIDTGRAEIIYDPTYKECGKCAGKHLESRLYIYYPTYTIIPEGPVKESLRKYYTAFSSTNDQVRSYYMSFRENTSLEYKGLPDLKFHPEAKKAIIVSAGPSLDKNYLELKNAKEDTVIIATAPTMSKLYKAGIKPNVVVISDTQALCGRFHEGAENADCPLVFSSTASVPFVRDHKGPRYIFCPEGFEPAERLAEEKNWPIIKSYGSVALTALALAIYKEFKEIVFIGQDLCYKGRTLHAEGTSAQYTKTESSPTNAKNIYGEDVTIPNDFALFKSQIEATIKKHPEIKFLNATEGGVHIEGSADIPLRGIFSQS